MMCRTPMLSVPVIARARVLDRSSMFLKSCATVYCRLPVFTKGGGSDWIVTRCVTPRREATKSAKASQSGTERAAARVSIKPSEEKTESDFVLSEVSKPRGRQLPLSQIYSLPEFRLRSR